MVCFLVQGSEVGSVVRAEFMHHLGYSADVVVRGADEANESFPGILLKDSDACESWSPPSKVGIVGRPLLV